MKRVLATLVALSLVMSMFTGVFAPVPAARAASPATVDLGTAGNFTILAKSGITNVPTSAITGDIGVSPAAASTITGFALVMDSSNQFSTSPQVTGKIYAADYASPTPANMTTAVSDMEAAYLDAALRATPDDTELGGGNISGMTLAPGLYKWSTGVLINSNVTLSGSASDVWIFQIAGDLKIASNTKVLLAGGAVASNVFWQVGGGVGAILGTYSTFNGNILSLKQVVLKTGAVLNGRALAQTLVTLDHNGVSAFGSAVAGSVGGLVYPTNKQGIMRQLAVLVALLAALCGLVVWSALVLSRRKRRNGTDTGDMQTGGKSGS
ncbi:MAG TPA: ice-binding family protein [Candidatus Cryosericum sp.]